MSNENKNLFNKILKDDFFDESLSEIKKDNIKSPFLETTSNLFLSEPEGKLMNSSEDIKKTSLDPKYGEDLYKNSGRVFYAYDESIRKFNSLEGFAEFVSHSIVLLKDEYYSLNSLTFNFFTNSQSLSEQSNHIKFLGTNYDLPAVLREQDKIHLLQQYVAKNTIILIDGPLISGNAYVYMIKALKEFYNNNIIPIFFVKNSNSNLVTNSINKLSGLFNSDLHWSYNFLDESERTNFFYYQDLKNKDNAKAFCYLKCFEGKSPQRVEIELKTYKKHKDEIDLLMNCIQYFVIAQGKKTGITPTMNQERFGSFYG